jgi:hypothetical protein
MARRRTRRKTTRRRSRSGFNIVNAAELYLSTDVLTRNFMGTNPIGFFTGQEYGITGQTPAPGGMQGSRPQATYGYGYRPGATSVTLPELLGVGSAPMGGVNAIQQIQRNFKANAIPAFIQYAGVKIGFKVGKKLLSKQRSFINNQVLKPLGMKSTVVV